MKMIKIYCYRVEKSLESKSLEDILNLISIKNWKIVYWIAEVRRYELMMFKRNIFTMAMSIGLLDFANSEMTIGQELQQPQKPSET